MGDDLIIDYLTDNFIQNNKSIAPDSLFFLLYRLKLPLLAPFDLHCSILSACW
ncbi:hypothetical protein YPPY66_3873 [Yersinia pestis PY-66]|uniref:Uncharacterized protein n=6 Tax=Yersinia pseudotuberculosis complex TaxID=1649845 RepID=Q8CLL5_YERPE|nr:hypothetical [Yersinia pestis KIM10+]AAS61075.1 hypothetical protein YP_0810 [Yersinia pestis biovar Microtus str. 91001]ABG14575.1 conserved hypothetical protein [Yersinia pestis Antiqua]ABG17301.1 conserved hypothetical protein [Yersinia pestis Nepal516]ABP41118.1 conserved hypothetical protein [Yersinia pestis Pestoides F]ABS47861.1 hypothetical protein YpsIP31758_3056 [Yersinia pseudotuberculosis IP 31758]ABX85598.1 hypothetical protein YpAngola_A2892 [Yersinia pestis Angola]ADV99876.